MKPTSLMALAVCALTLAVASGARAAAVGSGSLSALESAIGLDPAPAGRTCGTPVPTGQDLAMVQSALRRLAEERPLHAAPGGTIPVAFHVITSKRLGFVSDQQVAEQIAELNRSYQGSGYQFELARVIRTENAGWFRMMIGSGNERNAKAALAVDPAHVLNIYTCAPGAQLLGWAFYPWQFPEDHTMHGVVVHYGSVPGGYLTKYNLGRTIVHEVGHYLGLLHTFEGGCEAPGDLIDDTPFEAGPAFGCPEGSDTCPSPGLDPIHNYMDYGDDACVTEFTDGQRARMTEVVPTFRPSLFAPRIARASAEIVSDAAEPADLTRGIEFRGAGPNPFRLETAIRFTLASSERVRLEVFNVAGQRVRTLIDAQLPAGAHGAMFSGRGLPAGLYFLQLEVGRARMSRSAILLR